MAEIPFPKLDYSSIPEIGEALIRFGSDEGQLHVVSGVIRGLRLSREVCPFLSHRHYAVNEEELLVRRYTDDGFVVEPRVRGEFVPYAYVLVRSGSEAPRLVPFEYIDVRHAPEPAIQQCRTLIDSLDEIERDLALLPFADVCTFGVMITHPEPDHSGARLWVEVSDDDERWSRTQLLADADMDDEARRTLVQTAWVSNPDETLSTLRACCSGPRYRLNCLEN